MMEKSKSDYLEAKVSIRPTGNLADSGLGVRSGDYTRHMAQDTAAMPQEFLRMCEYG